MILEARPGFNLVESGGIILIRLLVSILMLHHGLEKLSDPQGFTTFVIDKYFSYLPLSHLLWTYFAAYTQLIASVLVALGILFRPALLSLCMTMLFALVFHFLDSGLQGAPFAIVEAHNYEFETSALYLLTYLSLIVTGAGQLSLNYIISRYIPKAIRWFA